MKIDPTFTLLLPSQDTWERRWATVQAQLTPKSSTHTRAKRRKFYALEAGVPPGAGGC